MAHVILRERRAAAPPDAARLADLLARHAPDRVAQAVGVAAPAIERLAREFAAAGAALAVAGGMAAHYPNGADIVAAVNVLNYVAGQVGRTVIFGPNHGVGDAGTFGDMAALTADLAAGRVGFTVSIATVLDETAAAADLVLPDLHPLEQWNDARPRAGVYALQQPVMQPVAPGARHAGDVLLQLAGREGTFKDYLQARWRALHARYGRGRSFEDFWTEALQHGGLYTDVPAERVRLGPDATRIAPAPP